MATQRPLVIVGVGGFGRESADVLQAMARADGGADLLGFLDDSPLPLNLERIENRGLKYLGVVDDFLSGSPRADFVVGIGAPSVRESVARKLEAAGLVARSLVHPDATVGSEVVVGPGTVICAGARITTNVKLGRHVHVNANATIGHDTVCEDYVSVNPGALVSGECRVGRRSLIGVGAAILQGLTVGPDSTVGGSACVTRTVPGGVVVKGVPAR